MESSLDSSDSSIFTREQSVRAPLLARARFVGDAVEVFGDGHLELGSDVIIGSRVKIHTRPGQDIKIGSRVWIGDDVEICAGVAIADFAMITAGSRVESDVEAYALIEGNPGAQTWRVR